MNKYQEALNAIRNAMYENVNYRGMDVDGQPVENYMGEDYKAELRTIQELIDKHYELQKENEILKEVIKNINNTTLSFARENQKQKKILDVLKNNVDICIDYKGKNPNDICFLFIYHDDGGKAIVNEISKEQYELFEEWKKNND